MSELYSFFIKDSGKDLIGVLIDKNSVESRIVFVDIRLNLIVNYAS